MKKQMLWGAIAATLITLTGCGSQQQHGNVHNISSSTSQGPAKIVKLKETKVQGMKASTLTVTSTISNNTGGSVTIKAGDFKLKIGAKTLISPTSASTIPSQVKANSTHPVKLVFPLKKLGAGKVQPVLMFKPETGQAAPELTQLPTVTVKH